MLYLLACVIDLCGLLAAFWITGRAMVRVLRSRWPSGAGFVDTVALGMGGWMAYVFALAAGGVLRAWTVLVPLVAAMLSSALWLLVRRPWSGWPALRRPRLSGSFLFGLALAAVLGVLFVRAAFPSISWDAAVYHLTLPKLFLRAGGFARIPLNFQSLWPVNTELLYVLALAWRGPALAALLHWACGGMLLLAFAGLARREELGPAATACGVALIVCNQVFRNELGMAYTDVAFALFFLLAFAAVRRAVAGEEPERNLVWAGVLCGLLCGMKLSGVLACASLGALWLWGGWRPRTLTIGPLAGLLRMALPAFLLIAPWLVRLWWVTGNPIYPFAFPLFGGSEWSPGLAAELRGYRDSTGFGRGAVDFALLPFRVLLSTDPTAWSEPVLRPLRAAVSARAAGAFKGFDGYLSAAWLAGLPLGLIALRRYSAARAALGAAAVYFAGWALITQHMRFLIAVLPLLALAAAAAIDDGLRRLPARAREAAGIALVCLASGLVLVSASPDARVAGRDLALMDQFGFGLEARLVPPVYRYLNEATPPTARVLFVNTNKGYYCDREFVSDGVFEASQVAEWLSRAPDEPALRRQLAEAGITHLLLERVDWGIRYPSAFLALLVDAEHVTTVFESDDRRFAVLEVR